MRLASKAGVVSEELILNIAMCTQVPAESNTSMQSLLTPEEAKAKA